MSKLEKKLKDLQKEGYEQITIIQVLNWIHEIRMNNRARNVKSKSNTNSTKPKNTKTKILN